MSMTKMVKMMMGMMSGGAWTHPVEDGGPGHAVGQLHLGQPLGHIPLVVVVQRRGVVDGNGRLDFGGRHVGDAPPVSLRDRKQLRGELGRGCLLHTSALTLCVPRANSRMENNV